ncbi:MAG: thiamine pyrophosphate-dependent enzyme [bacterium]|nr:thiamine pyrophosphate-dependent enzyme [bacterium]
MEEQIMEFASGNEMAAIAVKQIGYDLMGYYPITPSTQIAESLDAMKAAGETDIVMIEAEGEHSAAGICYGASVGGGRVFNATSANGLLYAIEQLPVQSGTRYPMVMNVVCRTVSGPLSIKGDHSDIMYLQSCGWPILFANTAQQVYDFNIVALKVAETVRLPVVVAYDGFFTSHQKKRNYRFTSDKSVRDFLGKKKEPMPLFDFEHPISVGSYMNEPYLMNNRYQLHLAVEQVRTTLPEVLDEFQEISGRDYQMVERYPNNEKEMLLDDTEIILILLGSAYETAIEAVDDMRAEGKSVGVVTVHTLCPFPAKQLYGACRNAKRIIVGDRQDNYGAGGGSLSLAVRAALQRFGSSIPVSNIVYGLGGQDFVANDAKKMFDMANNQNSDGNDACPGELEYYGVVPGEVDKEEIQPYFMPLARERTQMGITQVEQEKNKLRVIGGSVNATAQMPKRLAPGHGACPGCGIVVNLNLLLRAIEDPVVLLFQTGCGMIITTPYPKTCFKVPYVHNLFQNGAATLSGIAEMAYRKQAKGELPEGDIVFIMVSGDGGLDIGMGSALGTALRGHRLLIFEYDNGGYMNTGYQMSYSTPKGAKSSTSHIGKEQYGKSFYAKDMAQIMAASHIPYVATAAESNPADFIRKAAKAAEYAKHCGTTYLKALSACPLNWNDKPANESKVIEAAVNCCYFPLYEIENGITTLNFDPEEKGKKIPVGEWFAMMGRTKHLSQDQYKDVLESIQAETDRRFHRLREMSKHPML